MRFLDLVCGLHRGRARTEQQLDAFLFDSLPWDMAIKIFSPDMLAGQIRLADFLDQADQAPVEGLFEANAGLEDPVERMYQSLLRNAKEIISETSKGPIPLSRLLTMVGFEFHEGENPSDFVGLYAFPDVLSEHGVKLVIGHRPDMAEHKDDDIVLVTTDPVLYIEDTAQ